MRVVIDEGLIEGVPTVVLRTPDDRGRVEIAPSLGGLGTELVLEGVHWLFRNRLMSLEARRDGRAGAREPASSRYVRYADVGLKDFCLATVGADALAIPGTSGETQLGDHGLAWSAANVTVEAKKGAAITTWDIDEAPFRARMVRETTLVSAREVLDRFTITNGDGAPLPAFWSTHDMFALTDDTRYGLEAGTPMVVFQTDGEVELDKTVEHAWPHFRTVKGDMIDLSRPGAIPGRYAAKVFSAKHAGPVTLSRSSGPRLELSAPESHVALWTNNRGWFPLGVASANASYRNLCMERSSAPTDKVSEARGLRFLGPGESIAFEVGYRSRS